MPGRLRFTSTMHRVPRGLLPACLSLALCGCLGAFTERYARGNAALSTNDGAVYLVVLSPVLQQVLNLCIPPGTPEAAPVLVLVANVNAEGYARDIAIKPDSAGTTCVERALRDRTLPKPPLKNAETLFPIGLKIESR